MFQVVGSVINDQLHLVGLAIRGDIKAFGEVGEGEVTRLIGLGECGKFLGKCTNFKIQDNKIVAKSGVKLSDLKMYHKGLEVSNEMTLTKRLVQYDKVIGYEVTFGKGDVKRFSVPDCVKLTGWFKATNFLVNERNGKKYLSGKRCKLDELPTLYGGKNKKATAKKETIAMKSADKLENSGQVGNVDIDLLDIFNALETHNCYIIETDKENYKRVADGSGKVDEQFIDLNLGKIASAKLSHHKDKVDCNLDFKKAGLVQVDGVGPVLTYTHHTKTIFRNGKNHMGHVGIVVEEDKVKSIYDFLSQFGANIKLESMDNDVKKNAIKMLTGLQGNIEILKLDLSGIPIMSEKKYYYNLLHVGTVLDYTRTVERANIILKAIKPQIKEFKNLDKKVCDRFAIYGEEALKAIAENNIDIYTGGYKGIIKKEDLDMKDLKDIKKQVTDEDIAIVYSVLPSTLSKITANQLWEKGTGVDNIIDNAIKSCHNMSKEELLEYKDSLDSQVRYIRTVLWLHKVAMVNQGNYKYIHQHNKDCNWELVSENTKSKTYAVTSSNEVLKVKVTPNLSI